MTSTEFIESYLIVRSLVQAKTPRIDLLGSLEVAVLLGDEVGKVHHAVRVAPFVVVP